MRVIVHRSSRNRLRVIAADVVAAYLDGKETSEIRSSFGISLTTMYRMLQSAKIPLRIKQKREVGIARAEQIRKLYQEEGMGASSIREQVQMSPGSVYNALREGNVVLLKERRKTVRLFTKEEDAEIVFLYEQKAMTVKELAVKFNATNGTIRTRLKEAGVQCRNWTGPKQNLINYQTIGGRLCRFRSSWEQKFAQHLDRRGLGWAYESHTYILSDGTCYTPDFWIPDWDVLVEVKGYMMERAKQKIDMFRSEYPHLHLLVLTKRELKLYGIDVAAA